MSEIKFKRDTSFRKQFFVPDSFAHPAKMDAQLLIWIAVKYTKVGETILDPMAGSGTTMLACTLGRDAVLVELEEKFCKMIQDNWNEVRMRPQLGYQMGNCQIIQGDARQLEGLVDKIVTSPPYEGTEARDRSKEDSFEREKSGKYPKRGDLNISSGYQADSIITSPPYEGSDVSQTHMTSDKRGDKSNLNYRPSWKRKLAEGYAETKRPYREVDSIITSPPYSNPRNTSEEYDDKYDLRRPRGVAWGRESFRGRYSSDQDDQAQIGNLKSDSYLEAMLQVYQQCFTVLRPQGLMILVTKNFIRNKQVVRLDTDTIKLCEQAGFKFLERHYRRLPSQSFWRVIYHQKHPGVEQILNEDVLVFDKPSAVKEEICR